MGGERIDVVPPKESTTDRLKGKVVLITGATSGIGQATAVRAAKEGAKVAICGRRKDRGAEVVSQIKELTGSSALFVACDVNSEEDIKNLVRTVANHFGRIDGCFVNAGRGSVRPESMEKVSTEEWESIHRINARATFLTTKYVMSQMRTQQPKGGNIVVCSSVLGIIASPLSSAYMSTKASNLAIARAAAAEGARHNIRANSVCPGAIETEIWAVGNPNIDAKQVAQAMGDKFTGGTMLRRLGQAWEIAQPVCFLLSDESSYITGVQLSIDAGLAAL
eukprot:TRINITY_DN29991_c0_g1_i1.p1 TRINITY_DN29991_c0_g1~~TRINITY_DN29991_c0_g1_i1.p1  ORF type:complete len:278 (-),score=44.08 TRINITY_DN29991_c0_g1_i1:225-1058(-)